LNGGTEPTSASLSRNNSTYTQERNKNTFDGIDMTIS
jgi:hypothetical protein